MFTHGRRWPQSRVLNGLLCGFAITLTMLCPNSACAQGAGQADGQPWITFFAINAERLIASAEAMLEANNSPELAEVLHEQVDHWLGETRGLNRQRLLGWMQFWPVGEEAGAEVLLLPVADADELLKMMAGTTAKSQRLSPHHAMIERGDSPYHIWFEGQSAWMGNSLATLKSLASRRDWERQLGGHDAALRVDLRQIPQGIRDQWGASTSQMLAAFVQQRDGEPEAQYAVRKAVGQKMLAWLATLPGDVNFVELAFELQPARQRILVDLTIDARPGSPLVTQLSRWKLGTSSLAKLWSNPEGLLTAFINMPDLTDTRVSGASSEHQVICIVEGLDLDSRTVIFGYASSESRSSSPRSFSTKSDSSAQLKREAATELSEASEPVPSASFERVTLGDEHLWWRRWLKTNSVGVRQENEYGVWWAFGYEDGALETIERMKSLLAKPQSSAVTGGLGIKLSPTFLAALLDSTPPARGSTPPADEESIELRITPTGLPSRFTVRLILPAGVLAQLGRPLAAELSEQLEHRIRPNSDDF